MYGYFASNEDIIHPDCNIDFENLKSRDQYYDTLNKLYGSGPPRAWLTPVEIFKVTILLFPQFNFSH